MKLLFAGLLLFTSCFAFADLRIHQDDGSFKRTITSIDSFWIGYDSLAINGSNQEDQNLQITISKEIAEKEGLTFTEILSLIRDKSLNVEMYIHESSLLIGSTIDKEKEESNIGEVANLECANVSNNSLEIVNDVISITQESAKTSTVTQE